MASDVRFPTSPVADENGYISLEWQQWLQNPQFVSIIISGVLAVASGGTGLGTGTSGGVLGFTSSTVIASSGTLGASKLVLGGGVGATPSTPLGLGTTTTVLHGNAAGAPTWGAVSLTADVSGILPYANGGIGANSLTAISATINNSVTIKEWLQVKGTANATRYIPMYG